LSNEAEDERRGRCPWTGKALAREMKGCGWTRIPMAGWQGGKIAKAFTGKEGLKACSSGSGTRVRFVSFSHSLFLGEPRASVNGKGEGEHSVYKADRTMGQASMSK